MTYRDLLWYILHLGREVDSHFGKTKEVVDVKLVIPQEFNFPCFKTSRTAEHCWKYEKRELSWYWSGDRSHEYISKHASLWEKIQNRDGTLNSNYGYLVYYMHDLQFSMQAERTYSSFEWAYENLKADKGSRRAVMLYNSRRFNYLENKDYICSQEQHFLIRDDKLVCIIPLRSSDAIYGLTFNIPWWSLVQQDLRLRLLKYYPELQLGEIIVNIHSAHIYEKHFGLVESMLADEKDYRFIRLERPVSLYLGKKPEEYFDTMNSFITVEQNNRKCENIK